MTYAPALDPVRARCTALLLSSLTALFGASCGGDVPVARATVVSTGSPAEMQRTVEEARALFDGGDPEGARARLEAHAAAKGEDGVLLTLLTEVLLTLGDVDAAVEHGERAIELAPESSDAHLQYSRALGLQMQSAGMLGAMRKVGTYKDALRRARELDPANLDARTDEIAFNLAAPGIVGGSVSRGRTLAEELTALDRGRGLPLLLWAISADEDIDAAVEHGNAALRETPDDRGLHLSMARMLGEEERVAEALPHFERALAGEKDADYYDALYQLARLRVRAEVEPELAIPALEEYASEAPSRPGMPSAAAAWWRIGNARELQGDVDAARAAYEESLRLDPEFERATEALEELD